MQKKLHFLFFLLFISLPLNALAEYPERPIKFLVAAEPDSTNDVAMRYFASLLSEELGQKIIVENPYGDGGSIVIHMLMAQIPDGYTIAATDLGPFGSNIYASTVRYQLNHIAPISILYTNPLAVITTRESVWFTLEDVFKPARESGRRIRVAHTDSLSLNIFELVGVYEEVEVVSILQETEEDVYRMLEEGYADIAIVGMAGFTNTMNGRGKLLASTGSTRHPSLPYALTLNEQGYEKAVYDSPFILSVPTAVPEEIKQELVSAINKVTSSEEYLAFLAQLDLIPTMQDSAAARALARHALDQVRFVIKVKEEGLPDEEEETL